MRIPTVEGPNVAPGSANVPYLRGDAPAAAFGGGVGAALQQTSSEASKVALQFQREQNENLVNDVYSNQLSPIYREATQNYYALSGKDAVDQLPIVAERLEKSRTEIRDKLENEEQRRMFDRISARRKESELEAMGRFSTTQNRVWRDQTNEAIIRTHVDSVVDRFNDDEVYDRALRSIDIEVEANGMEKGQSRETIALRQKEYRTKAAQSRIERVAIDDPVAAQDMLDRYGEDMDSIIASDLRKKLKPLVNAQTSGRIVENIVKGNAPADFAALKENVSFDDLKAAVATQESGDRDYDKDGNLITSPKGAEGAMQVLPTTQMNPGFGVEPARNDSPEELRRVGEDYLAAMLKRYSGNQTLALAAYNGGPGSVDKWIERFGNPNSGEISSQEFAEKIPFKETRDYVQKINGKVSQPEGTIPTTTEVQKNYSAWKRDAERAAEYARPGDNVYKEQLVAELDQYVARIEKENTMAQKAVADTLLRAAIGDGQNNQPASLADLLKDPDAKDAWANAEPATQKSILAMLNQNAKSTGPAFTPEALSKYYEIVGLSTRDPEAFSNLKLDSPELVNLLPRTQHLALINLQASTNKKEAQEASKQVRLANALSVADSALRAAGIVKPSTTAAQTPKGQKLAARYDQFVGRYSEAINTFREENGKNPDEKQMRSIANSLLVEGAKTDSGFFFDDTTRAFEVNPSEFYVPLPSDKEDMIISKLTTKLGRPVTEREAQEWYTKFTLSGGKL